LKCTFFLHREKESTKENASRAYCGRITRPARGGNMSARPCAHLVFRSQATFFDFTNTLYLDLLFFAVQKSAAVVRELLHH
jgi:hypothetical protein